MCLREPRLRINALGYLVLYNLMFILPLVIILIAGLAGVGSEAFSRLMRKHLGTVKLLTAAFIFSWEYFYLLLREGFKNVLMVKS